MNRNDRNNAIVVMALIVLFVVCVLTSCSVSRKVSETSKLNVETQIDRHSESATTAKADTSAWHRSVTIENVFDSVVELEYLPVPTDTGYVSVVTRKVVRSRRSNVQTDCTDSLRAQSVTAEVQHTDSIARVREEMDTKVRTSVKSNSRALYYAPLLIVVMLMLIYILYHRKPNS